MDKRSKAKVEKAIALLHEDDKWDEAMLLLLEIVGRKPNDVRVVPTTLAEIIARYSK